MYVEEMIVFNQRNDTLLIIGLLVYKTFWFEQLHENNNAFLYKSNINLM